MRRWGLVLLTGVLCYGLFCFSHKKTAGFQVHKICSSLPANPAWETPSQDLFFLTPLFEQPFYYLGKGGQSYAFVSADGSFVLKLFKMHNLRQYPFIYRMTFPPHLERYKLALLVNQKQKLERLFQSALLSYTVLKEESALVALSLNPRPEFSSLKVTLVDKIGIRHTLSLDKIPFAIQLRGIPALQLLKQAISDHNLDRGKYLLDQMILCIKNRQQKGIGDLDPSLKRNMGFVGSSPFFMDIGGFVPLEKESFTETTSLRGWLQKRSPELTAYLDTISN